MGIGKFFKSMMNSGKVDLTARYEILRDAVSGTMSDFHMARDRETKQIIGLKILDVAKTEAFESRFTGLTKPQEGVIAMAMEHPHIVKTFKQGISKNNEHFLVMEFLEGPGLNSLVIGKDERLKGNRLTLLKHGAEALKYVHTKGYIHRDVCPRNFVCDKTCTSMKLIDFGLTVPAEKEYMQPGNRTGTPNYMAPEVVRRRPTDQRLDIYAFGASIYEMFAFELPWARGQDGLAAMSHGMTEHPPLSQYYPEIHPVLEQAIMTCIEPEPEKRYESMEFFLKAIRRVRHEDKSHPSNNV